MVRFSSPAGCSGSGASSGWNRLFWPGRSNTCFSDLGPNSCFLNQSSWRCRIWTCSRSSAFSSARAEEDDALGQGSEAVEFMTDIIPEVRLLYPSKTLELAVFLHLNAIDQQLQIRQG